MKMAWLSDVMAPGAEIPGLLSPSAARKPTTRPSLSGQDARGSSSVATASSQGKADLNGPTG